MAGTVVIPLPRSATPHFRSPRSTVSNTFHAVTNEYDARLDEHQQTYVLSPRVMKTLTKAMTDSNASVFTSPSDKIGFHGPRRPLLLSYPATPRKVGTASFLQSFRSKSAISRHPIPTAPSDSKSQEGLRLAFDLRSSDTKDDQPPPRKPARPSTVPKSTTKTRRLAKEKGFVLDGIAVGSIQDDYGKLQPKMGPAIPPYNAHFDRYAQAYFGYKGVKKTLGKTGQIRNKSESNWGKEVDRFHFIGHGHDYLFRRNLAGAGYSRDIVDGHDEFLSHIRPIDGFNGKFGYRRNTPLLRYCPSPFGVATWSPIY